MVASVLILYTYSREFFFIHLCQFATNFRWHNLYLEFFYWWICGRYGYLYCIGENFISSAIKYPVLQKWLGFRIDEFLYNGYFFTCLPLAIEMNGLLVIIITERDSNEHWSFRFSITRVFSNFHAQLRGLELVRNYFCPLYWNITFLCHNYTESWWSVSTNRYVQWSAIMFYLFIDCIILPTENFTKFPHYVALN